MKKIFLALAIAMTFTVSYSAEPSNVEYTIEQKDGKVTDEEMANEFLEIINKYDKLFGKATKKEDLVKALFAFEIEVKNFDKKYKAQQEDLERRAEAGDKNAEALVKKLKDASNKLAKTMETTSKKIKK